MRGSVAEPWDIAGGATLIWDMACGHAWGRSVPFRQRVAETTGIEQEEAGHAA
jgi:hypothetical protein